MTWLDFVLYSLSDKRLTLGQKKAEKWACTIYVPEVSSRDSNGEKLPDNFVSKTSAKMWTLYQIISNKDWNIQFSVQMKTSELMLENKISALYQVAAFWIP